MKNLVSVFSLIYYACKILLIVSLFQWWMGAHAAEKAPFSFTDKEIQLLEESRDLLNDKGDDTFDFKETIHCSTLLQGRDPYVSSRGATPYYRCPDQTLSFPQPDSTGAAGWNGYCGQTAVANLTAMMCGRHFSALTVDQYASDITPGNLPATNGRALRRIFTERIQNVRTANPCPTGGSWKGHSAYSGQDFIDKLKVSLYRGAHQINRAGNSGARRITPVAVLMASGFSKLHWVTLVDFRENRGDEYGCDAIVNTWGHQKVLTCHNLARYGATVLLGFQYIAFER